MLQHHLAVGFDAITSLLVLVNSLCQGVFVTSPMHNIVVFGYYVTMNTVLYNVVLKFCMSMF